MLWVIKSLGPTVGPVLLVLGFFLWKDWRREDRLQGRVDKLEQEQKEVMLPMIEKCVGVISRNTAVMLCLGKMFKDYGRCYAAPTSAQEALDHLMMDAEKDQA
jgi:hypothetical protein